MADFREVLGLTGNSSRGNYDMEGIKAVLEALSGIQFSEPLKSVNGSFSANRTDSEFRLSDYEICPLNEKCRGFSDYRAQTLPVNGGPVQPVH